MRNWKIEFERRVSFIREVLLSAGLHAVVFGNSGGKDSALVGILCKAACPDTLGIIMPCETKRNFTLDRNDALAVARQFEIETITVDVTKAKEALVKETTSVQSLNDAALQNVAPRLRMTTLYAVAAARGALVAGTGNASERALGYFTKWGDGACDFNPIADLKATEIFDFLRALGAPSCVIDKAPSAGLSDSQTDEQDLGVKYCDVDRWLNGEEVDLATKNLLEHKYKISAHKRAQPLLYTEKPHEN